MNLTEILDAARYGRAEALRRSAKRNFAKSRNPAAVQALLGLKDAATDAELFRLGECYEMGKGALPNPARAVHWYEAAAQRGYLPAMEKLGEIYLSGRNAASGASGSRSGRSPRTAVERDFVKALHWNSRAAEGGLSEAQARLASQYAAGLGVAADHRMAERWFRASAQQDCASGQFGLGALYASGISGQAAEREAVQWFEKAAEKGNAAARMCLGIALLDGRGLPADPKRALKPMTQAAESGLVEAMFRLGQLHRNDKRVEKNISQAESWLRRASVRGHIGAMLALAQLLTEDLSSPDYISAAAVLRTAADQQNARAQFELGRLYARGKGVVQDLDEARHWLSKAAQQGIAEAHQALATLEQEATRMAEEATSKTTPPPSSGDGAEHT